jgi:DNA-binding transcriptional MerR regulator
MRIKDLAARAGVAPDTIRYYERVGLLGPAPRAPNGYREYGEETLDDLRFIHKAQALGLKLRDIQEVMEIAAGGRAPCEHVRAALDSRLQEVETRLRELKSLRATLREALAKIDRAPTRKARCRCPVIEATIEATKETSGSVVPTVVPRGALLAVAGRRSHRPTR